ncbi:transcription factor E4F1 isoform X3 [Dromiciops gliroides]|uniref:transcription factor E4F1 isoform X3 n=1 Tax=Dromiciops gliroides TaxID=33562 RepID=UPI001CC4DFCA|nr:transcription factor E4F1 isoform X3 [Dromiciops gliroides]
MEGAMAVRVAAAHTAGTGAGAGRERGEPGGAVAAAASAPSGFLGLATPFSEEDEDDVHKCGRCQSEFTTLEDFVQHKIQKACQRTPQEATTATAAALLGQEQVVPSGEESITVAHIVVETSSLSEDVSSAPDIIGGGHIKEVIVAATDHVFENPSGPGDSEVAEGSVSPEDTEQDVSPELLKVKLLVNKEGRYVCELCHKTFKTASILKAHMITHSSKKDYECKLCGTSFRTKGSLIRHHRRHTDERPYKCKNCGKSFRESGALTRHLKSLTPCTEKIRFNMNKEIVVSKEDVVPPGASDSNTETVTTITSESIETAPPVIHLVTDDKGTVIHEVHVQMQELPVDMKTLAQETSISEKVPSQGEVSSENLLRQAMQNSGLVIERVAVEEGPVPAEPCVGNAQEPGPEGVRTEQHFVAVEEVQTADPVPQSGYTQYSCPQCVEVFRSAPALEVHAKAHVGQQLFRCEQCGKEFPKAYLLKKHQEVHVRERRFRCGECGKLYKTIAHVKGHRRVHSDERPYACPKCGKRYKTKNAQQVHFRIHLEEKPHVCQFCSRGFREKGSLVRHVRHHTGEKPFKCYKCGRGFAEHGTLNRHLRTKGGCLLEVEEVVVSRASPPTPTLAEDAHTVLVEFSSVVADTQEYIIEVDSHIMKVVQQIVHQAGSGHQIIVQNVTVDEDEGMGASAAGAASDTITIATPESLTEQVAMTLASAIGEGAVLTTRAGIETEQATVTMVASEDIEILEHAGEFVISSQEGELEVQTVIV